MGLGKDVAYEYAQIYDDINVIMNVTFMKQKLFTKSAFKVALTCPRQLYYYGDESYANQNNDDSFLMALAEGGFQVGELAKIYYDVDDANDIKEKDYQSSINVTNERLKLSDVNIAEAAFRYKDCFVRVDILKKTGTDIELVEVKAKSWTEEDSFLNKKGEVASGIREYLYDVAFQKWVVVNALKDLYPNKKFKVKAFLMMADKGKVADVDGMNQCFRIVKDKNNRSKIERTADAENLRNAAHVLTPFDVDEICDMIIKGETGEQDKVMGNTFVPFINAMSQHYCNRTKAETEIGSKCFSCPFYTTDETPSELKDGYKECWKEMAGFKDEDFKKPLVKDLWGAYIKRNKFIVEEKYFLKDLSEGDFKPSEESEGLHHVERKLLQIALATNNDNMMRPFKPNLKDGTYIDVEGLRKEMSGWVYPLHMIDFETTSVALPFYKGLHPYEQVAFQFSHHIIEKNGTIRHIGQYLNTKKGFFPNFEFIRELKRQLENDNGSVFRYSNHENTILRCIYEQLDKSEECDKKALMDFIDTITHKDEHVGERDMIDLWDVVKKYYYHPSMKGSNSIKVVLPVVLNSSSLLKEKYSRPVYGTEIISQNYDSANPKIWISYDEDGNVENPYKHLEKISEFLDVDEDEIKRYESTLDESVCNGGAALAAYSKLQFSDDVATKALEEALLRYCELDTLAMVFIWEYFNEMI